MFSTQIIKWIVLRNPIINKHDLPSLQALSLVTPLSAKRFIIKTCDNVTSKTWYY